MLHSKGKNLAKNNPDFASFQKNILEEKRAQNGNCFISSKEEEEKAYTRMIRDKDKQSNGDP